MKLVTASCVIENHRDRLRTARLARLPVSEKIPDPWLPAAVLESIGVRPERKAVAFDLGEGGRVKRPVGFVVVRVGSHATADRVVFAESQDTVVLGWRSLSRLRLKVDAKRNRLVAAGPTPAPANLSFPDDQGGKPVLGEPYSLLKFAALLKLDEEVA
jgi:hypothetical protein